MTILLNILSLLLVPLCFLAQSLDAGKKQERMRLGIEVWFALIYCICALVLFSVMLFIPAASSQDAANEIYWVLFFPGGMYFLYLLLASLLAKITDRLYIQEDKQNLFASFVYIRQKRADLSYEWVVRPSLAPYRPLVKLLCYILLALTEIALVLDMLPIWLEPAVWSAAPWCALPLLHCFSLYLQGKLARRTQDEAEGAGLKGTAASRYALAAEHLQQTFRNALLFFSQRERVEEPASPESTLHQFETSGSISDLAVAAYFRSAHRHEKIDPDYIRMAADLTDGKNVLIHDPFYHDLGPYLALPLSQSLMMKHKALIVCQGGMALEDVQNWARSMLDDGAGFQEKWKIRLLDDLVPDCDAGILSYTQLYNPSLLAKNRAFFQDCEYVVLLHPSSVLTTMQISLSVLAQMLQEGPVQPVYAIIDRQQNGLKDTLSHVLRAPIATDLVITANAGFQTTMIWDADADFQAIERFDKQTRYLGGGIEIGAEAVSVQVPETEWISEKSAPVKDLQSFAMQSYRAICRIMHVESSQSLLQEKLGVRISRWDLSRKDAQFLIAEDEEHNPFAAAANYVSRGDQEVFLNILSENYLLRDYFCANADLFAANPSSIPALVPGYARTKRNTLLQLILKMRIGPVSEEEIRHELDLSGIHLDEAKGEEVISVLYALLERYTFAKKDLFVIEQKKLPAVCAKPETILHVRTNEGKFEEYFSRSLKNISYILEDETVGTHILDTGLYSLIVQTVLPGQFLTFDGKSYVVRRISPQNGVILQRASDLIDGRRFYRQLRRYHLPDFAKLSVQSCRNISGFAFTRYEAPFSVETMGYLEMHKQGDFAHARIHDFSKDPSWPDFVRTYTNKTVLTIQFPGIEQSLLYQMAMLLQEILPSVLPQSTPYLSVLAKEPAGFEHQYDGVVSQADPIEEGTLVIIEDSDMDLGLLDEFETNFFRLMDVVHDYLRWAFETSQPVEDPLDFQEEELDEDHLISLKPVREPSEKAKRLWQIIRIADVIEIIALQKMEQEERKEKQARKSRKQPAKKNSKAQKQTEQKKFVPTEGNAVKNESKEAASAPNSTEKKEDGHES